MVPMSSIAVLLPTREQFSPEGAGALAINAHAFATGSRFHAQMTVYGPPVDRPFPDVGFVPLHNRAVFSKSRGYLKAFRRALQSAPPGLIEVWNRPIFVATLKKWLPDVPIALHLANDPQEMRAAGTAEERSKLLDSVGRVFTCSDWARNRFIEGLPAVAQADRVIAIISGIDPPERLVSKEKLILFVGRIVPEKGVLPFAQAMRALLPHFPDWKAQIIGGVWHGREGETEYSRRVAEEFQQLGGQGTLNGYLPIKEVRSAMARAAILCVPSLWNEPLGRVALEGMAEGALVATTGRGGLSEAVGNAGLIIDSEDPRVWAESLRPWLAEPERIAATADKARRRAAQFTPQAVTARLDAERAALLPRADLAQR